MSRQAVFPRPEPYPGYDTRGRPATPPSRIVNKAMGSFGRREVELNKINTTCAPKTVSFGADIKPVTVCSQFSLFYDMQ
jgi:hypothetical protein